MTRGARFDVAVLGLGAVGAATLVHLVKAGVKVAGIDQHSPPHELGSSHGETRITRESIGEGAAYIPLVRRSHEIWRALEAESGEDIFTVTGGLVVDSQKGASNHGVQDFAKKTIEHAKQFGIPHEVLSPTDARRRFADFSVEPSDLVYFEPGAGFVRPEAAVRAQLGIAERGGAVVHRNTRVREVVAAADGVRLITESGAIEAARCLIAAGSWMKNFLPAHLAPQFKIMRQVLHWLPIDKGSYPKERSPVFIWCYGPASDDFIYGFPSLDGISIKVAGESFVESPSPEAVDRSVSTHEQEQFLRERIGSRLGRITGAPVRSVTCQYTMTPQSRFIIDTHPEIPCALFASCCSGHGFKHSAALGESLAARLTGKTPPVDLSPFRLSR